MKIRKIIPIFLISIVFVFGEENELQNSSEKNAGKGIGLGLISVTGILIPGTYGWGNYYAKDYRRFAVLQVTGSAFTLCTWIGTMKYLNDVKENLVYYGYEKKNPEVPPILYIGIFGSTG